MEFEDSEFENSEFETSDFENLEFENLQFENKALFHNLLKYTNHFCFGYIAVPCFFETFPGVAGWLAVWLGNLILMKTQSSVWTWTCTLDFELGFVKRRIDSQGKINA